jgi:hypothetical protein
MIAVSVMMHAAGLALMGVGLAKAFGAVMNAPLRMHHRFILFSVMVGVAAVLLALLHGLEASCWAAIHVWLGACPDFREAIYFSLQMVTTLGADVVQLETRWKLMGPLEAISGLLLFGLSTAFLFAVIQRAWPFETANR